MPIYDDSRAAWGALKSTNPRTVAPGSRTGVSWHYPGGFLKLTPASSHESCYSQVRAWQRAHQAKGWADIGYNLLICQHARVIEGRGADFRGSHSPGVNVVHYGVQFMVSGTDAPTGAMLARAVQLRAALEAHSGHTLRQWGHKDDPAASTDCPGPWIESWVHAGGPYKGSASAPVSNPTTPAEGSLTMSDVTTILAELAKLNTAVTGLRSEESGRNVVESKRYAFIQTALQGLVAKAGVDIDEAALAESILAGLTPAVRQAVLDAGQPAAVADAVVAKLGAALNPSA